jgi:hypothetical protein
LQKRRHGSLKTRGTVNAYQQYFSFSLYLSYCRPLASNNNYNTVDRISRTHNIKQFLLSLHFNTVFQNIRILYVCI